MNRTRGPHRTGSYSLRPSPGTKPATGANAVKETPSSRSRPAQALFTSWIDEGLERATRLQATLSPEGPDRLARLRATASEDVRSFYVPWSRVARIGRGGVAGVALEEASTRTIETTVHEATHHWIREVTGFPGLLAAGGPGRVGEGVAQVVAAAALVLQGESPAERAHGERLLDPSWQTTPVGELRQRAVPLSTHLEDLRAGHVEWWEDMGGVHVHAGIVIQAHGLMAKRMGMERMAKITLEAIEGLTPFTGLEAWARLTLRAAEQLHGVNSLPARQVLSAWVGVGFDAGVLRAE